MTGVTSENSATAPIVAGFHPDPTTASRFTGCMAEIGATTSPVVVRSVSYRATNEGSAS